MKPNIPVDYETFYFSQLLSKISNDSSEQYNQEEKKCLTRLVDFLHEEDHAQDNIEKLAGSTHTSDLAIFFSDVLEHLNNLTPDSAIGKIPELSRDFLEIFQVFLHDDEELQKMLSADKVVMNGINEPAPAPEAVEYDDPDSVDLARYQHEAMLEEITRHRVNLAEENQAPFADYLKRLVNDPGQLLNFTMQVGSIEATEFQSLHQELSAPTSPQQMEAFMAGHREKLKEWSALFAAMLENDTADVVGFFDPDAVQAEEAEPTMEAMFDQVEAEFEATAEESGVDAPSELDELVEKVEAGEAAFNLTPEISDEERDRRKFLRDYIVGEITSYHSEIGDCITRIRKKVTTKQLDKLEESLKGLRDLGQIHSYTGIEMAAERLLAIHSGLSAGTQALDSDFKPALNALFEELPHYVDAALESNGDAPTDNIEALLVTLDNHVVPAEAAPQPSTDEIAIDNDAFADVAERAMRKVSDFVRNHPANEALPILEPTFDNFSYWSNLLELPAVGDAMRSLHGYLASIEFADAKFSHRNRVADMIDDWSSDMVDVEADAWRERLSKLASIGAVEAPTVSAEEVSLGESSEAVQEVIHRRIELLKNNIINDPAEIGNLMTGELSNLLVEVERSSDLINDHNNAALAREMQHTLSKFEAASVDDSEGFSEKILECLELLRLNLSSSETVDSEALLNRFNTVVIPAALEAETTAAPVEEEDEIEVVFRNEAKNYVAEIKDCIERLRSSVHDTSTWHRMGIIAHTLRGSAQMVSKDAIAEIAEPLDSLTDMIENDKLNTEPLLLDIIHSMVVEMEHRLDGDVGDAAPILRQLNEYIDQARIEPEAAPPLEVLEVIETAADSSEAEDSAQQEVPALEGFIHLKEQDPELLEIFQNEVSNNFDVIEKNLTNLSKFTYDKEALQEIERAVHDVRGAAKMLGISEIADITDRMERIFELVIQKQITELKDVIHTTRRAMLVIRELTFSHAVKEDLYEEVEQNIEQLIENGRLSNPPFAEADTAEEEVAAAPSADDDVSIYDTLKTPTLLDTADLIDDVTANLTADEDTEISFSSETDDPEDRPRPNPQVLEIYSQEAREQLEDIGYLLMKLEKDPASADLQQHLMRCMHTLKGSSGMVYAKRIEAVSHVCEDILEQKIKNNQPLDGKLFDTLFEVVDEIGHMLEGFRQNAVETPKNFNQVIAKLKDYSKSDINVPAVDEEELAAAAKLQEDKGTRKDAYLRLNINKMNHLLNVAAELVISNNQFKNQLDRLKNYMPLLNSNLKMFRDTEDFLNTILREEKRLQDTISAFSDQQPGASESVKNQIESLQRVLQNVKAMQDEVTSINLTLKENSKSYDENLQKLNKLSNELLDEIMQARLVPINLLFQRFHRPIRDLAKQLKKKIRLVLKGENTELDRTLVDDLYEPILHIVRNSIDHGLETKVERKAVGKSEDGLLEIKASQDRNQVIIEITDDGRGINPLKVRETIVAKGLATQAEADALSTPELYDYLFAPGFSTASETTLVSGRGVGLDAVKTQIEKAKGDVRVSSEFGKGTRFSIRVPISLSVIQSMLVDVNGHVYSIPLMQVEETLNVGVEDLQEEDDKYYISYRENQIPVVQLSHLLKMKDIRERLISAPGNYPVVMVQDEGNRVALLVDKIIRREEILIKSLGPGLRRLKYISGGSIMADGQVVLVLDIPQIVGDIQKGVVSDSSSQTAHTIDITSRNTKTTGFSKQKRRKKRVEGRKPIALVVDDSLSIRKYLSSLLMQKGFVTETARNGYEALELLNKQEFDIMVTDLEMPKLSGYELIETLRYDQRFGSFPIIVLTGRAGENFRQLTTELGADSYIVKPFKDRELFDQVEKFIEYKQ